MMASSTVRACTATISSSLSSSTPAAGALEEAALPLVREADPGTLDAGVGGPALRRW